MEQTQPVARSSRKKPLLIPIPASTGVEVQVKPASVVFQEFEPAGHHAVVASPPAGRKRLPIPPVVPAPTQVAPPSVLRYPTPSAFRFIRIWSVNMRMPPFEALGPSTLVQVAPPSWVTPVTPPAPAYATVSASRTQSRWTPPVSSTPASVQV